MARYIDADKMVSKDNAYTTFPHDLAGCDDNDLVRWINEQPTADVAPKSEVDRLELTLQGVMWSVDKWLDEADYDADPVKRAITMREKTLQIVENAKSGVERLQEEANRYKRYYFRHDYDEMIAEVLDKLDRFINANCIVIKDERGIKGYVTSSVHFAIAELKKKYTGEKDG